MSDTAETPDSPEYGFTRAQWLVAVEDPHWFVCTIAPDLVGHLTSIQHGIGSPKASADDAMTAARALLDHRAAFRAAADSAPVGRHRDPGPHHAGDCPRRHSADSACICGRGRE